MKYMRYAAYGRFTEEQIKILNKHFIHDEESPSLVFSFGGDGTMLGAIHKYKSKIEDISFVGINVGKLGFFTDFVAGELDLVIQMIKDKSYRLNAYNLLEYSLFSEDEVLTDLAVNEIAITNPVNTQIIEVYVNNKRFQKFRGTGILISPPTGSTAYNKSLGGSVIDPKIKAIQLTELAPINNRVYTSLTSSLVLSEESKIELKFKENTHLYLSVDGKHLEFPHLTKISAKLCNKKVAFIEKEATGFFDKVRRAFIKD